MPERGAEGDGGRVPVEPGFWIILLGDLVVFAAMFVAFILGRYEDAASQALFRESG